MKRNEEFLIKYAQAIQALPWKPYEYQKKCLNAIFVQRKKKVFANWARGSGKSDIAMAALFIQSILYPKSSLYYISFTMENASEVIWHRMKEFFPKDYVKHNGFKNTDLEVHFTNDSIIRLRGSTADPEARRGSQPSGVVFDEFREHSPTAYDSICPAMRLDECFGLFISTPPYINESKKWELYSNVMKECEEINSPVQTISCWDGNPKFQNFYKQEQLRLMGQGRLLEFQKEYEAKFVRGSIQPMFPEINHGSISDFPTIMRMLQGRRLKWIIGADTSGWKRWGILFSALDLQTRELFWVDCFWLSTADGGKTRESRESAGMSGYKLWPRIEKKMRELCPHKSHKDWDIIWDSQDAPIMDDINRWYGNDIHLVPVDKNKMVKSECFGFIRDLQINGKLWISSRCEELVNEFQALEINPKTGQPKDDYTDLIAAARYQIHMSDHYFDMTKIVMPVSDHRTAREVFNDKLLADPDKPLYDMNRVDFLEDE